MGDSFHPNSHCNTDPKQQQQSHEPPRPALLLHHTILNPAPSSHLLVAMFIKSTLRTVSLVARQHQTRFLSTSVVSQSRRSLLAPLPSIITGSDSSVPRPSKEAMAAHYNQYLDVEEADGVTPAATATATAAGAAPVAVANSTSAAERKEEKSAGSSSSVHLVDDSASYRFSLA